MDFCVSSVVWKGKIWGLAMAIYADQVTDLDTGRVGVMFLNAGRKDLEVE